MDTGSTTIASATITARVAGRNLFIDLKGLLKQDADFIRSIPAGFLCATGAMMFPATLIIARRLVKRYGDSVAFAGEGSERLQQWLAGFVSAHRLREAESLPPVPGEKMPSWLHQRRGYWFGVHLSAVLLSEKVGAGKTKQILDICSNRQHRRVLTLTTASAVDDWPEHVRRHASKPYSVLALGEKWRGKNATRKADAVRGFVADHEFPLVALSYDSAWRPPLGAIIGNIRNRNPHIGTLAALNWDCGIFDELHKAADPTGRTSLFLWRLAQTIPYRIGATGTTIRHKLENVFSPFRILDPGIFGIRYANFLERYCVFNRPSDEEIAAERARRQAAAPSFPGMENISDAELSDPRKRFVVGYKRTDELAALMSAITYDPGDVDLDLPIPINIDRRCFLPMKAQRHYDELDEELATTLEDGTEILTANVLTKMLRLHQLAGGFLGEPVIDPNTGEVDFVNIHEVHDAKETALTEILDELDKAEPVVVVGRFSHDLTVFRRVAKRLGRKVFEQSGRRKERIKWQSAAGGEILAAQIQSACEAIDLTRAGYMILYSVGFSMFQYTQMRGRIDRPGQKQQPRFVRLITAGTIDERIYAAIAANADIARDVIRQMREYRFAHS